MAVHSCTLVASVYHVCLLQISNNEIVMKEKQNKRKPYGGKQPSVGYYNKFDTLLICNRSVWCIKREQVVPAKGKPNIENKTKNKGWAYQVRKQGWLLKKPVDFLCMREPRFFRESNPHSLDVIQLFSNPGKQTPCQPCCPWHP